MATDPKSLHLNLRLPEAVSGSKRLIDIQRVKSAIEDIDLILSQIPKGINSVTLQSVQSMIINIRDEIKGGVSTTGDTLKKIEDRLNALQQTVDGLNTGNNGNIVFTSEW